MPASPRVLQSRQQALQPYKDLTPNADAQPLTQLAMRALNTRGGWFGTQRGEGYILGLLDRFEERHPEAAKELDAIANEATWTIGHRAFTKMILEVVG